MVPKDVIRPQKIEVVVALVDLVAPKTHRDVGPFPGASGQLTCLSTAGRERPKSKTFPDRALSTTRSDERLHPFQTHALLELHRAQVADCDRYPVDLCNRLRARQQDDETTQCHPVPTRPTPLRSPVRCSPFILAAPCDSYTSRRTPAEEPGQCSSTAGAARGLGCGLAGAVSEASNRAAQSSASRPGRKGAIRPRSARPAEIRTTSPLSSVRTSFGSSYRSFSRASISPAITELTMGWRSTGPRSRAPVSRTPRIRRPDDSSSSPDE